MDNTDLAFDVSEELYDSRMLQADAKGRTAGQEACAIVIAAVLTHPDLVS